MRRVGIVFFFFFKQKTAYEIQGDWSSDVCSSDLRHRPLDGFEDGLQRAFPRHRGTGGLRGSGQEQQQRGQQQPLPRRTGQAAQPRKTQSRICRKTESRNGHLRHGSSPSESRDEEVAAAGTASGFGDNSGNGVSSASASQSAHREPTPAKPTTRARSEERAV